MKTNSAVTPSKLDEIGLFLHSKILKVVHFLFQKSQERVHDDGCNICLGVLISLRLWGARSRLRRIDANFYRETLNKKEKNNPMLR